MRPLSRTDAILVRQEAIRFSQYVLGSDANKAEYLDWIGFFERVQLEGAKELEGVYAAPVVPALRIVGD